MSPLSPVCTSRCSRQRSSLRRCGGDPNRPCANGGASPARRPARRHSGRYRRESCDGTQGTHTPWWLRMAAPAGPRPPRSRRPTSPSLPEKCPRQQTDDGKNCCHHEHVVGGLGDELAIRVEAHRLSIVLFPSKPSGRVAEVSRGLTGSTPYRSVAWRREARVLSRRGSTGCVVLVRGGQRGTPGGAGT